MIPTDDQRVIMDYILEQIESPDGHNVIVSGQGGTGKTVMICELICELLQMGHTVAVAAMTGKATAVLRDKIYKNLREKKIIVEKEALLIETVTKITKESKVLGVSESGETMYTGTWKDPALFKYDILILDEISMVPHYISAWWQKTKARVIGLGDHCQLPEVITTESKNDLAGFRHDLKITDNTYVTNYGVKILRDMSHKQLSKVLRSDNEVALLCNDLRDFSKTKAEKVELIKGWAGKTSNIEYSTALKDLEVGNDWQIISYTNRMCREINNHLCIGGDYPSLIDKIILFDNLNPIGKYNGDTMQFKDLLDSISNYNIKNAQAKIYVCVKWQGKMPARNTSNGLERAFFNTYAFFKDELERIGRRRLSLLPEIIQMSPYSLEQKVAWNKDVDTIKKEITDPALCFMEIIKRFEEIERDMVEFIMKNSLPLPRLYIINVDYGYAITVHKSQGSEYRKVCYIHQKWDNPLLYTACSRAKEKLKIINLTQDV